MDFADLHMHSVYSDGDWAPLRLVRAAASAGLGAVALTDHDDIRGLPEARAAGEEFGVRVLPGVELSAWWNDVDLHLLAYGFDPDHPGLGRALQAAREARVDRAERITARLTELGVPVTMDSVREIAGIGAVGRPHVARALLEAGHVTSIRDAFDLYLGDGKPACEPKDTFDPATAIDLVHRAGGVAVAAHPGVNGGPQELVPLLALGLDGVEVRHPNHGRNSQEAFDEFARIHGLLRTGGSDFHGPRLAGLGVGTVSIPRDWWDDLERGIQEKRAGAAGPRVVPEES